MIGGRILKYSILQIAGISALLTVKMMKVNFEVTKFPTPFSTFSRLKIRSKLDGIFPALQTIHLRNIAVEQ